MNRVVALVLFICCLPLFIITAIIILFEDGWPFFFIHDRAGINSEPFRIYKFRTMRRDTPLKASNRIKPTDSYVLKSGKWLRKLSIDEWPNLINIIKGDMNFIGPRPVILSEKKLLKLRHSYGIDSQKPGITGYAQINGRDLISIERKVVLERYYLYNKNNVWLNFRILLRTIIIVLRSTGVRF
ncbi:sugar transferase [Bacteroidia bacterium]|nr:sugar transferase [Bacteroidia bacterium]